jgi:DNA repair exonuclease SbcCD ATPase subunit
MSSARVSSLEALVDLKAALCVFSADAKEALSSVEMEIQRTLAWLDEQLKHWRDNVRKCEDEVFQAKAELTRKRMLRVGDRPPDCSEQEEALQLARERLAYAEDKVDTTRRWQRLLPEAIIDYEGPAKQLAAALEADMPRTDALLESKIVALESYIQLTSSAPAAPSAKVVALGEGNNPETATAPPAPAEKGEAP